MADHFIRTQNDATWTAGSYTTLASDWRDLSRKIFKAVNGDRGGTWSPRRWDTSTTPVGIKIGGSGLKVTGVTKIDYGGTILFTGGSKIILGNNDWPLLGTSHVGRKRSLVTPTTLLQNRSRYLWQLDRTYMAMRSVACTLQLGAGPSLIRPDFYLPLRVHNGATLKKATLRFRVPVDYRRLPYLTPKMRIIRVDEVGNATPLKTLASGADSSGYISFPTPSSPSAWYASGAAQSFSYECNQNNIIDTSLYHYYAHVIEEQSTDVAQDISQMDGLKEKSIWFIQRAYVDPIPAGIPNQAGTGHPAGLTAGQTFVLLGQGGTPAVNPISGDPLVGNGVWFLPSGTGGYDWTRWRALDHVKGLLLLAKEVYVFGAIRSNTNTVWELSNPDAAEMGQQIYRYPTPQGNIYHSITCDFENIVDMRPQ